MKFRHKVLGSAVFAGALIVGGVLFANSNGIANKLKAATNPASEYVLELNKNNRFTEQEAGTWGTTVPANSVITRKTTSGNDINFLTSGGRSLTAAENNVFIARNNDGWFCNQTPLSGLYKIDINCSAGATIRFDFGSTQPLNGYSWNTQPDYVTYQTSELTGQSSYTIDLTEVGADAYFSYFRFQQISDGNNWVSSIKFYYTCVPQHAHDWVHIDRVAANRGNDGHEEYYECSVCGALLDKDHHTTTMEALTLKSTLYTIVGSATAEEAFELPEPIDKNATITVDLFIGSRGVDDPGQIYFSFRSTKSGWQRTSCVLARADGTWEHATKTGSGMPYGGVTYLGKTTDDYMRFEIDLSQMDKENGFVEVSHLLIYQWNHSAGFVELNTDGIAVLRGHYYEGRVNYDTRPEGSPSFNGLIINIDVLFVDVVNPDDDYLRIMLGDGWDNFYGYFKLTNNGATDTHGNPLDYVTMTILPDGYKRFTIRIEDLEADGIKSGNPSTFTLFYVHNWSGDAAWIDFSTETHTHSLEHFDRVEPFRETGGNIEYNHCTECDRYYDKDMNKIEASSIALESRLFSVNPTNLPKNSTLSIDLAPEYQPSLGDTFVIDIKMDINGESNELGFLIGDSDSAYFGKFWVQTKGGKAAELQGNYGAGVTAAFTSDEYLRVSVVLDESVIAGGGKTNIGDIVNFDYVQILGGIDYQTCTANIEIMPQKGELARGYHNLAGANYTYEFDDPVEKASGIVTIDILFLDETGHISLMIGDWNNYSGYYELSKNTTSSSFNGVSLTQLDDGYIRFEFTLASLTKVNDKPLPANEFQFVFVQGKWCTTNAFIDISYTEEHTHTYNLVEFDDAFRENTGTKAHYECTSCGKLFDLDYNEIEASDIVEPSRLYSFGPSNRPTIHIPEDYWVNYGDTLILDFKVEKDEHAEVGFTVGDGTSNYFGKFWIESVDNCDTRLQRNDYGITSERLTDGYLRVNIPIDKNIISSGRQTNPDSITKIDTLDIWASSTSGWPTCTGTVEIMPSKGTVIRGSKLTSGTDLTIDFDHALSNSAIINVDVFFASPDTEKISLCIGDWTNYYGYFSLFRDPSKVDSFAGLTITQLDDGYVRFTFDLSKVTRINNSNSSSAVPNVNHVYIRGMYSSVEGYVDVSYTDPLNSPVVEDIY